MKKLILSFLMLGQAFSANARECAPSSRLIRISATGDILVHQMLYRNAVQHPNRFRALWADLIPTLQAADYTVGNLEGPIAPGLASAVGKPVADPGFVYDGRVYSGTNMIFNYHPYLLTDLRASGFDLVTIANNHTLDRGPLGVDRTIDNLEKSGLDFTGIRRRGTSNTTEHIENIKGAKIAFISCAEMTNGWEDPYKQVTMCGSSEVVKMIRDLKNRTDGVIVFPHWGLEYKPQPNERQKKWAREWIAAGASAVIGNHPHVLQTVEFLPRPDGETAIVVYSLGNFVSAQGAVEKRLSAIAHLDFGLNSKGIVIEQFSYTPTVRVAGSYVHQRTGGDVALTRKVEAQLGPARCSN